MKNTFILTSILLLFSLCSRPRLNFDQGYFPNKPVNFKEVNSEFDDYNSDIHQYDAVNNFSLIFSTNRNSKGANFDFISYRFDAVFDQIYGDFSMSINVYQNYYNNKLVDTINTTFNELGPYSTTPTDFYLFEELSESQKRFFYASDADGNLNIMMMRYDIINNEFKIIEHQKKLPEINSSFDDAYPCIVFDSLQKKELLYFTSNRDNNFDICMAESNKNVLINNSTGITVKKVDALNSGFDDKCPFIIGNTMVFTSNRPGGMGGFDLWYSVYSDSTWSEPKNFGNKINTESDEYRPVICQPYNSYYNSFYNQLMIFSSNRPGGLGGFDLYYVGISNNLGTIDN